MTGISQWLMTWPPEPGSAEAKAMCARAKAMDEDTSSAGAFKIPTIMTLTQDAAHEFMRKWNEAPSPPAMWVPNEVFPIASAMTYQFNSFMTPYEVSETPPDTPSPDARPNDLPASVFSAPMSDVARWLAGNEGKK